MADLTYTATLDDKISPALKRIETNVGKVKDKFDGLKSALAGLAIGAAIRNVINLADGIQDVSDATGIAVQNILGFQQAVQLNGGTAEQATQAIYKLTQSIGDAASGGQKAQDAFGKVGVSIKDLSTLSEQDILNKTIDGLSKIDDASVRSALSMDLLGKSARGLNIQGVAGQMQSATAASVSMAAAIRQTADMQNKLDLATQRVQLAILKAIQPLVTFINSLDDQKIASMIDSVVKLAAAIAGLTAAIFVIEKVGKGLILLTATFAATYAAFKIGLAGMIIGFGSLATTAGITLTVLKAYSAPALFGAIKNGTSIIAQLALTWAMLTKRLTYAGFGLGTVIGSLIRMIPFVAALTAAVYLLNEAIKFLTDKSLGDWFDTGAAALENFVTNKFPKAAAAINKLNDMLGLGPSPSQAAADAAANANEMKRLEGRTKPAEQSGGANRPIDQSARQNAIKAIRDQVDAFAELQEMKKGALELETRLIGKSEEQKEIAQAQANLTKEYRDAFNQLEQRRQTLGENEKYLNAEIIKQQDNLTKVYHQQEGEIVKSLTVLQSVRMIEEDRKRTIENTTKAIEDQISRQQQLGDLLVSGNDKMVDIKFAGEQQGRSPLQKQLASIQEEARKGALEAGRAFSAAFEGMDLNSQQAQELADGLAAIAEQYKAIATEQTNQLEASRSWSSGWKTAFDEYMDNATNAAQKAGQVFGSVTRNMESAIDNFVDTGKFKFSDLARSIIQDLIKIELKAQATKLLGMIGGGGGIFSAIGSLFGFANGGTPPLNRPSIVGERGPELFVPRSAGTIVPNHKLTGGGNTQVAAPITNNYITNNISAIDAKSVAQLFAENRKTLLGSVQMAQKELPYGNR